jgi:hypothetical protein
MFFLVTVVLRAIFFDFFPVDDMCLPWVNFSKKNEYRFTFPSKNLSLRNYFILVVKDKFSLFMKDI